jgi:hypothetical protein
MMKSIVFSGLTLLLGLSQITSADPRDDALSALLRCSGTSDKAQRLVCYDSAIVRIPGALHAPSAPIAAPVTATIGPIPPMPAAPPVVAHRPRSSGFIANLFGSGGPKRSPQTTAAQFGSESIANGGLHAYPIPMDEDTIDEITARMTSYDLSSGYLVATLDNGQIWRQVGGDPVGHLERRANVYVATISRGGAGAYDMKLSHFGRTLPVRRIR